MIDDSGYLDEENGRNGLSLDNLHENKNKDLYKSVLIAFFFLLLKIQNKP